MEFIGSQGQHVSALTWFHSCVLSSNYVSLCDNERGQAAKPGTEVGVRGRSGAVSEAHLSPKPRQQEYNVYNQVRRMGLPLSGVSLHRRTWTLPSGWCLWGSARLSGAVPRFRATSPMWPCVLGRELVHGHGLCVIQTW